VRRISNIDAAGLRPRSFSPLRPATEPKEEEWGKKSQKNDSKTKSLHARRERIWLTCRNVEKLNAAAELAVQSCDLLKSSPSDRQGKVAKKRRGPALSKSLFLSPFFFARMFFLRVSSPCKRSPRLRSVCTSAASPAVGKIAGAERPKKAQSRAARPAARFPRHTRGLRPSDSPIHRLKDC